MRRIVIGCFFGALLFFALEQQAENPVGRVPQLAPSVFSRQGDRDRRSPHPRNPAGDSEDDEQTSPLRVRYPLSLGPRLGQQRACERGSRPALT